MRVLALLALACLAAGESVPVLVADFGDGYAPLPPGARVNGALPTPWLEDSAWAQAWVRYGQGEEEGTRFLRVAVERVDQGRCQFDAPLPPADGERFYHLTLRARSPSGVAIEIGLRSAQAPYTYLWRAHPRLSREWQRFTYDFAAARAPAMPVGVWIGVDEPGELDLAELGVTELSAQDLAQRQRELYRDGGPPNVVRVAHLWPPLPVGWHLDGESDFEEWPDAPLVMSPAGDLAVPIRATHRLSLWSAPFTPVMTLQRHCGSLLLGGRWKGRLTALCDGIELAHADIDLTGAEQGWQRPAVVFTPRPIGGIYALRLDGEGEIQLAGIQVNPGEAPTAPATFGAGEIKLRLPDSTASAARVQFVDEPASVLWSAEGAIGGATVRALVADHGLRARELPPHRIPDGATRETEALDFADPAEPFGPFRIQAWLERDGQRISPTDEIVVLRLPRPRHWGEDAPESSFGVHCSAITRHVLLAKAIGANWVRLHDAGLQYVGWWWLEPERGKWTFFDEAIHRYRAAKLSILGELGTAPRWASRLADLDHEPRSPYFARFFQPKDLADYATYVRTVAERYRDDIRVWQPWNEPWNAPWWPVDLRTDSAGDAFVTSADPQGDFVKLQETAREALDTVDPRIALIGVSTAAVQATPQKIAGNLWTAGCLAHGALESCQAVDYHQYEASLLGYPGDAAAAGFAEAIGPLLGPDRHAPRPVWMTEGSAIAGRCRYGLYQVTVPGADVELPDDASNRLVRWIVSTLAQGVEKVFVYSMHGYGELGRPGDYAALVCADGSPHPCAAAYAALAWRIEDCRFAGVRAVTNGIFAYLFQARDGSRSCAVLLAQPLHDAWVVPAVPGGLISDLYGDPLPPRAAMGPQPIYVDAPLGAAALAEALGAR